MNADPRHADTPIAIVGVGAVVPGAATVDAFWANVAANVDTCRDIPPHRWTLHPDKAYSSILKPDRVCSRRACLIDDFSFDPAGLALDPDLLAQLDPVYHLTLDAGRQAFHDARMQRVDRSRVGVILAAIALPTVGASSISREVFGRVFEDRLFELAGLPSPNTARRGLTTHPLNSRVTGLPAALLAQAFNLGGGSYTLDAACASSLYAIKLACDELQAGRADAMLTGGVSRPDCLYTQMGFTQLRSLSPSGRCAPFDARADGLVVGEGAVVFVLKRLDDALEHGDAIYGVIRGIGLSNDIGGSLLAPDSEGQLRAMRQAYGQAGWTPDAVDLIECHGTGTPLGDAVELRSLRTLWTELGGRDSRRASWPSGVCPIGSVKSMIGHLLTAAGGAGLLKALLGMRHGVLPPSVNFERPADDSPLIGSPFRVQTQARSWDVRGEAVPRRAAISAFGFGGINAHVLVEEWPSPIRAGPSSARSDSEKPPPRLNRREDTPALISAGPSSTRTEPIAVVGMSVRIGRITSLREFASCIFEGRSVLKSPPVHRWHGCEDVVESSSARTDLRGAFIDKLAIPIGRFKLPPNEIPEILPQQLLMLLAAADAVDDANLAVRRRPDVGAFIGIGLDPEATHFHLRWWLRSQASRWAAVLESNTSPEAEAAWVEQLVDRIGPPLNATRTLGALGGMVASRVAREFGLGGPSFGVSCEEASGLRALEIAVRALQRGELNAAIVGAVDLCGDARAVVAGLELQRCASGDRSETAVGEGAVAVVLKRLADAERDGDRVYAVIRGAGAATGDVNNSRVATEATTAAIRRACVDATIELNSVGLLETSGSLEAESLASLFERSPGSAAFTSPNAIIGNCGATAGIASFIKTCLCLQHELIPPIAPRRAQYWLQDRADGPRRGAVLAATHDGNCHCVIVEQHPASPGQIAPPRMERRLPCVFVIEGRNAAELQSALNALAGLAEALAVDVHALRRRWTAERPPHDLPVAASIVVHDVAELRPAVERASRHLIAHADKPLDGRDGVFYSPDPLGPRGRLAFVFPGSGSHFVGMGADIGLHWPEVLRRLNDETEQLASHLMPWKFWPQTSDASDGWERRAAAELSADQRSLIFGQVSYCVAMSDLLRHCGLRPGAAIGYSLGESASLFAMRAWPDRDEMYRRMMGSPLFATDLSGPCDAVRAAWNIPAGRPVRWKSVLVPRPATMVRDALNGFAHARRLIVNTPNDCVIGGLAADVDACLKRLGCRGVLLDGVPAVHIDVVQAVEAKYRALHDLTTTPPAGIDFYSAVLGRRYEVTRISAAESITGQAMRGFDFSTLVDQAYRDGLRLFVEVGPQATCTRMIDRILEGRPHFAMSASARGAGEGETVVALLAALAAERVPIDWDSVYACEDAAAQCEEKEESGRSIDGRTIEVQVGGPPMEPILPPRSTDLSFEGDSKDDNLEPVTTTASHWTNRRLRDDAASLDDTGMAVAVLETAAATARAHDAYLRFAQCATEGLASIFALPTSEHIPWSPLLESSGTHDSPRQRMVAFDREACLEFARGAVANVLGPDFAEVDTFPVRVRLPDEPLMLVDRILSIDGLSGSLASGRLITEHDVLPGAWYLDGGVAPVCITVEAGQADLFLSSYLGIDLAVRGSRAYRLLDATVSFHRGLPRPGETIQYDIRIDRFVCRGDTYLFFFQFDGTINGRPMVTMRDGCAGFFTAEEVEHAGGVILKPEESAPAAGRHDPEWRKIVPLARGAYDENALAALRRGDLAGCFGPLFDGLPLKQPVGLPDGRMRLIDRVVELDPSGGRFGLGRIRAAADIKPDDWFLTCHFVDDMVMPGTLMYECCVHTLRFFLLRLGWVAERDEVRYEPIPGIASGLRCRGPVTPRTREVIYEVDIKEIGYRPEPYVLADAMMYADGRAIVRMSNMSLKLTGLTRERIEAIWSQQSPNVQTSKRPNQTGAPSLRPQAPSRASPKPQAPSPLYDRDKIRAFAIGKPSEAFGEPYRVFDEQRRIARLPGPPYSFMDRVTKIEPAPWALKPGGWIEAEYDVPPDAWYFAANRQPSMPFCVLLEAALQPCGWLAAYLGSALHSETDLKFRNLGGRAALHEEIMPDAGTVRTRVRLTKVSQAGGMIIENFDMQMLRGERIVYEGSTSFGFFSDAALAQQVGIRDAASRRWVPTRTSETAVRSLRHSIDPPAQAGLTMPADELLMIDRIDCLLPDGGPHGLGYLRGSAAVNPDAWFFKAHFYQDPVWPGSLGLESILQLLKVFAMDRWPKWTATHRFEPIALGVEHTWTYRGQIIPTNEHIIVEASIGLSEDGDQPLLVADGFLSVDGTIIYEMGRFGLRLVQFPTG